MELICYKIGDKSNNNCSHSKANWSSKYETVIEIQNIKKWIILVVSGEDGKLENLTD